MTDIKVTTNIQLLIVEDNQRYMERLVKRLKKLGYQTVTTAYNEEEAIQQLTNHHFDVIVADMRLDHDDGGFIVLDKVTELNLSSIVIIFTANENLKDCYISLKTKRAWDYVSKTTEEGSGMVNLHHSIQEALAYTNSWGNPKDTRWIAENINTLLDQYQGQYIAVMNNRVIEAAESEAELEQRLAEKRLPRSLSAITKVDSALFRQMPPDLLLIFTEGPTDVLYIKTALQQLGRTDLLERVVIDAVGSLSGKQGSGEANLRNGFTFLQENRIIKNKVLFLTDQDVTDKNLPNKGHDSDNLYVRRIGGDYARNDKGIEWLFDTTIFEEGISHGFVKRTVVTTTTQDDESTRTEYDVVNKMGLCRWICHERQNSPANFAGFQTIIDTIDEILNISQQQDNSK
ncbi:response regulator [Anaerolineales bacterium HSG24]|nr:response regulator [Anaerolineales bacterium HSG24]